MNKSIIIWYLIFIFFMEFVDNNCSEIKNVLEKDESDNLFPTKIILNLFSNSIWFIALYLNFYVFGDLLNFFYWLFFLSLKILFFKFYSF